MRNWSSEEVSLKESSEEWTSVMKAAGCWEKQLVHHEKSTGLDGQKGLGSCSSSNILVCWAMFQTLYIVIHLILSTMSGKKNYQHIIFTDGKTEVQNSLIAQGPTVCKGWSWNLSIGSLSGRGQSSKNYVGLKIFHNVSDLTFNPKCPGN